MKIQITIEIDDIPDSKSLEDVVSDIEYRITKFGQDGGSYFFRELLPLGHKGMTKGYSYRIVGKEVE